MATPTLFDSEAVAAPIELGVACAERCADNAEARGWDREAAAAFVLAYLRDHGPTAGEVLVTEASRDNAPHDARAFGSVFLRLSRAKLIEKCGHVPRTKGRGTSGGNIWRLTTNPEGVRL